MVRGWVRGAPRPRAVRGLEPMKDSVGDVQNVLVIGGTSQIGSAAAAALLSDGPGTIVLAGRDPDRLESAATSLRQPRRWVDTIHYDGDDPAQEQGAMLDRVVKTVGDLDVILVCVGVMPDQTLLDADTVATAAALQKNMLAPAVAAHAAANALIGQGHGTLVVLSSIAAIRPRASLLAYSAAKSGLDAYARGLGDRLHGTGASVLVVRPGYVRTRMTEGTTEPAFTVNPDQVGAAIARGVREGRAIIHVPPVLGPMMALLRLLPTPLFRRLARSR
jgi:decaprenylphospho-beta-D-erythro-pentofuranosid-2-ulose 2-reductase